MRLNSLAFRLFVTALSWTMVVLPVAGFLVYSMYAQEVFRDFDNRIRTLLSVVQADIADHTGTELGTPGDVGEPLFQRQHSGWYWQVTPIDEPNGPRRVSNSLATAVLLSPFVQKIPPDALDVRWMDSIGPLGQRLRIAEAIERLGGRGDRPALLGHRCRAGRVAGRAGEGVLDQARHGASAGRTRTGRNDAIPGAVWPDALAGDRA